MITVTLYLIGRTVLIVLVGLLAANLRLHRVIRRLQYLAASLRVFRDVRCVVATLRVMIVGVVRSLAALMWPSDIDALLRHLIDLRLFRLAARGQTSSFLAFFKRLTARIRTDLHTSVIRSCVIERDAVNVD